MHVSKVGLKRFRASPSGILRKLPKIDLHQQPNLPPLNPYSAPPLQPQISHQLIQRSVLTYLIHTSIPPTEHPHFPTALSSVQKRQTALL